jgi:Right handed beta helix region
LLVLMSIFFSAEAISLDFYVNPNGKDEWIGTLKEPDKQLKNGPFKTLERAKQAVRDLKNSNAFNDKLTIHIAAGHYYLDQPLHFDLLDSGLPGREIIWQADAGEEVVISGGIPVSCIKGNQSLWECPVKQLPRGKDFFDTVRVKGNAPKFEVFVNEEKLQLSRWPNQGWAHIKNPVDKDTQFSTIESLPNLDEDINSAQVHIFPGSDWFDQYIGVALYNSKSNIIKLSSKTNYPLASGRRFYLQNVKSFLDAPGEWFYDQQKERVLVFPPKDWTPQNVILTSLSNVILIEGTNYLNFKNLVLQHSAGTALLVKDSENISLSQMNINSVGGKGIEVVNGSQCRIENSEIHHTGFEAIDVKGGDIKKLLASGHQIQNNHIHHMGTTILAPTPAIRLSGVGIQVTHNLLEQGAGSAILLQGNEHRIEKNEVRYFCMESSDCGAIYSGRNWGWRGNAIRYNFIHNIIGYGLETVNVDTNVVKYRSPANARGIYLDDGASGFDVYGNIIQDIGHIAVNIGGGRDNKIVNNYISSNKYAIIVDDRWPNYSWTQNQKMLEELPYKSLVWQKKYPELLSPMKNYKWPEGNLIENNIIVSSQPEGLALQYFVPESSTTISRNIVWGLYGKFQVDYKLLEKGKKNIDQWQNWLAEKVEKDSIYADPCATVINNKISFCPSSPKNDIGFKPIPDDIGIER